MRRAVVAATRAEAADALDAPATPRRRPHQHTGDAPSVVFMMPGGGAQYAGMGAELYEREPVYRDAIDALRRRASTPRSGSTCARVAVPGPATPTSASARLERPSLALPALFATEYAMAKLLESWGIEPGGDDRPQRRRVRRRLPRRA